MGKEQTTRGRWMSRGDPFVLGTERTVSVQGGVSRSEWKAQVRGLRKMFQEVTGPQNTPDTHEAPHIPQNGNSEHGKKGRRFLLTMQMKTQQAELPKVKWDDKEAEN